MMSENQLKDGATQTLPPVERHPFTPFLPEGCRLLMLGSFPPGEKRWTMHFYYPNFTNDMWRIFGICFFQDKMRFVSQEHKTFFLDDIKSFLTRQRIGMYDTATAVRRLKNTASDKDLMVALPYRHRNDGTESHRHTRRMLLHQGKSEGWRAYHVLL